MAIAHGESRAKRPGGRPGLVAALVDFPGELRALRRWVAWRAEIRNGKSSKRPLQLLNDERKWLSFSEACDFAVRSRADGVGFVLGDGIVGIDLDACINVDGTLHAVARDAIETLGTYAEKSPSGRGLHLLVRGAIKETRKISKIDGVPGREVYDGRKGSARFFTVTGERFGSAQQLADGPQPQAALDAFIARWFPERADRVELGNDADDEGETLDADRVLQLMFEAKDAAKWRAIFDGDHSGYPSRSEADLALCRKLRFYTRGNRAQMDALFRRSGLMRPKWDEKRGESTYGEGTIKKAIALGGRLHRRRDLRYSGGTSEGQFGKVHRSVLPILAGLRKTDILTYLALAIHANSDGGCCPSATAIANLIGTTREHAQNSIANLTAAGLASVTTHPGTTSSFRLTAFGGVSNFDTGGGEAEQCEAKNPSDLIHSAITLVGRRRGLTRSVLPVSNADTAPVSKFDTRTDKEQSIDTWEGETSLKDGKLNVTEKALARPKPCIPLCGGARDGIVSNHYAEWDGTANTPAGLALLWDYAEEKLGLIGLRCLSSNVFGQSGRRFAERGSIQPELGL